MATTHFLYNFFIADANSLIGSLLCSSTSLNWVTSSNFIFLYLLFLSVTPVSYISVADSRNSYREHLGFIAVIYLASTLFLFANNLFTFIFFYEMGILPIFFVLRKFGHYYRRTQAAFLILIWALLGSFFLFIASLLAAYFNNFSLNYTFIAPSHVAYWCLFFFCLGFLVKVPMWPFHFWISRAHAEGPTNMSIFLSGVLVKLSVYGILRVFDFFLIKQTFFIFFLLSLIGVVDSTLKMLVQVDSKVVIAFSTTVQMNFALFMLFTFSEGSSISLSLALLNHMLTASILFFISDTILVRFNTREFFFLTGLYAIMPLFSFFLLISLVNQINFPGFLGFVLDVNFLYSVLPVFPVSSFILFFFLFVIEHLYVLYFFLKICFGVTNKLNYVITKDLSLAETTLFFYLLSISVFWGLFPKTLFLFPMFNYRGLLRRNKYQPIIQKKKGKVLITKKLNTLNQVGFWTLPIAKQVSGSSVFKAAFCWQYTDSKKSYLQKFKVLSSIFLSSALVGVAPGGYARLEQGRSLSVRLPSGYPVPIASVKSFSLGRAPHLVLGALKASNRWIKPRKLSVRGSAKNAVDHYNGGKGTGGFSRFV